MAHWAIILAAGESKRMGAPKPFLKLRGKTFIEHIYNNVQATGVERTVVVFARKDRDRVEALHVQNAFIVWNRWVERGQIYSLKLALRRVPPDADGILVCLVDHPCVRRGTYKAMMRHARRNPGRIIIPVHDGKRGHPVIFPRPLFGALKKASLETGARGIVEKYASSVVEWQTSDAGVLTDIDTPAAYQAAQRSIERLKLRR
jgi:molybdenum cofactor cytidylyltransferase